MQILPGVVFPDNHHVLAQRRAACRFCTESQVAGLAGMLGGESARRCKICKCFVYAKTKLVGQQCPLGKW